MENETWTYALGIVLGLFFGVLLFHSNGDSVHCVEHSPTTGACVQEMTVDELVKEVQK